MIDPSNMEEDAVLQTNRFTDKFVQTRLSTMLGIENAQ